MAAGAYRQFWVLEPKRRLISAAPYRDRVVHHALCNVIGPVFERGFIHDSYANRVGFGTHRALRRFTGWARNSRFVLQCDIRKYFPSMDHEVLKARIRRRIKCPETLDLLELILDSSPPQEEAGAFYPGDDLFSACARRKGLPIGNLTSQLMANVYLDGFDHFVKERLGIRKYLRYVDDFALFDDDPEHLRGALAAMADHLAGLRLTLNVNKTFLAPCRRGASFLGFHILPDRTRIRAENLRRARRRFARLQRAFARGAAPWPKVQASLQSWGAHAAHGDTWHLRQRIFSRLVGQRGKVKGCVPPGVLGRFVDKYDQA